MQELLEKDIEFLEEFNTPKSFCEVMFSDFRNPAIYDQEKCGKLRLFQEPFLSDETLIDFELTAKHHKLDDREKFALKKNVGDLYLMCGRKIGKTVVTERLDLINYLAHCNSSEIAFGSVDLIHINRVLDKVKSALSSHPILKLFTRRLKGAPNHKYTLRNNTELESVNFNIGSRQPGQQFYGLHFDRLYLEESSLEDEEVYNIRVESENEAGCVVRSSGMCNFTSYSPAGKAFYDPENKKHVINLPEYINKQAWDAKERKRKLEQYGGDSSLGWRVFVEGEIVTNGVSVFDMDRIRKACYLEEKKGKNVREIKSIEVTKERFPIFKNLIIVERPKNTERIFIDSDIGKHVTEIVIHSEISDKYDYLYNITLYNLTTPEKFEVFKHIIEKLSANVIGLDCGDGEGRALYSMLEKIYPKENLVYYDGSMKLDVDFELDENKNIVIEKGKPVYRKEYMSEFSVQRLSNLLYSGRVIIPKTYKFDSQFSVVMSMVSGTRTKYKCASESGDHLFDAWRVFAIAQFIKKDFNSTPQIKKQRSIGIIDTI